MSGGMGRIVRGEANFNIIGRAKTFLTISGIVLLASLGGLLGRHLNLSIDFKGGSVFTVPISSDKADLTSQKAVDGLEGLNLGEARAQIETDPTSGARTLKVTTSKDVKVDNRSAVETKVAGIAGQTDVRQVSTDTVGPTWGKQISSKALRGLIVFLILVAIYISIRFEPKMALGALAALFHDLLATAGIYALTGLAVTPATVIALLTLLGYSLYDTVVVFDKIQENVTSVGGKAGQPYSDIVNHSVNQVLMRSINTSLSTLLPIAALLFVGVFLFHARTLEDLATALFIGTIVGTYSSIFIASPILAFLKEREPKYRNIRRRLETEGRGEGSGRRPSAQAVTAPAPTATAVLDDEATRPARTPMRSPRPAPKPRKKTKKKRR